MKNSGRGTGQFKGIKAGKGVTNRGGKVMGVGVGGWRLSQAELPHLPTKQYLHSASLSCVLGALGAYQRHKPSSSGVQGSTCSCSLQAVSLQAPSMVGGALPEGTRRQRTRESRRQRPRSRDRREPPVQMGPMHSAGLESGDPGDWPLQSFGSWGPQRRDWALPRSLRSAP